MTNISEKNRHNGSRILLYSQRSISDNFHYRLGLYEFEDITRQVDSVDLITPRPGKFFKYRARIADRLLGDYGYAINPGINKINVEKNYDLFFVVLHFPKDLLNFNSVKGWKERCNTSICWLNEAWVSARYTRNCFLKILSKFDYVILNCSQSVDALQEAVQGKCFYLPYGIDAIQFCPYPNPPQRVIDVYSIGRRSEKTHQALLRMAANNKIFYVHDTIAGEKVINPNQHRPLFANMAKRSRYFIANPGKMDIPEETLGRTEIGNRFFEGAASGTIMIGETPNNEQFAKVFDWKDALIHLPFGSNRIDKIINELDRQPQRQTEIRKKNVIQSLLRHDWAYRWETVLKTAGLDPLPELLGRKKRLKDLVNMVEKD